MLWFESPTPLREGDPDSSFYNSSPFHGDHWKTLKVNEALTISFGTPLTAHVPNGTQWMKANREMGKMALAETPCFTLVQVPPHSSGNNVAFFFNWVRERRFRLFGNCRYPQESSYQYWCKIVVSRLCFLLFKYMSSCTWHNLPHQPVWYVQLFCSSHFPKQDEP